MLIRGLIPMALCIVAASLSLASCNPPPPVASQAINCTATRAQAGDDVPRVAVLIQPADNSAETAEKVADDVVNWLRPHLDHADEIRVTGFIYGGLGQNVRAVTCMDGAEAYVLAGSDSTRTRERREGVLSSIRHSIVHDVRYLTPSERASDPLPLLRQIADRREREILLWSTFYTQGETADCLQIAKGTPATVEEADNVIANCAPGRIPRVSGVRSVRILGISWKSPENPRAGNIEEAALFSRRLAERLCERSFGPDANCSVL